MSKFVAVLTIISILAFLGFCAESAQFATSLKHLQQSRIETALNQ